MKLKQFHDEYWWPDNCKRLRECTLAGYRGTWNKAIEPKFGDWEMDDITARDIEVWLHSDFVKPGPAGSAWSTLRIILREAYRYDLVEKDITRNVKNVPKPPPPKEQPVLDKTQVKELLDGLKGTEIEPFVLVSVTLGLRKEEGCALEWEDINLRTGEVSITKGAQWIDGKEVINPPKTERSYRTILLPEFATKRLKEIKDDLQAKGMLHPRITAGMTPNRVTSVYQREVKARGLPYVPPKNLRHSWATIALREGVPLATVSRQLGHYDVEVTANHYIVSNEEDFKQAQAAFQKAVSATPTSFDLDKQDTAWKRFKYIWRYITRGEL